MDVRIHTSAVEFAEIAEPLYLRDPILNTVELTLLRSGRLGDDPLLLTVWDDGQAVGAALQTPPYLLACNGIPADASGAVASELAAVRPDLSGVRGSRARALAFAHAWRAATGRRGAVTSSERLYRLGALRPPTSVSGGQRDATEADIPLLVEWVQRFFVETAGHHREERAAKGFVEDATAAGDRFLLWEDAGTPVSMAMLRAASAGVARIGPVFTPQVSRARGYGSAVTAAAAALAHRDGVVDVVLFADLANPTSNAIYRSIGFEAVADTVRLEFAADRG